MTAVWYTYPLSHVEEQPTPTPVGPHNVVALSLARANAPLALSDSNSTQFGRPVQYEPAGVQFVLGYL